MGGGERERDPIRNVNFLLDPLPGDGEEWKIRMGDVRRTNHALSVIQKLGGGGVRGVARRPFRYRGKDRGSASSESLSASVLKRVSLRSPPAGRLTGHASLVALVGPRVFQSRSRLEIIL